MTDQDPDSQPKKSFTMSPAVDELHAQKDTWRTHLMVWKVILGFVLLFGSLIALAIIFLKGLLK